MSAIPILIERRPDGGCLARSGSPLDLQAEGATEAEAVARIQEMWRAKVDAGAKLVECPLSSNPFDDLPVLDENDPSVQEWLQIMKERRNQPDDLPLPSDAA